MGSVVSGASSGADIGGTVTGAGAGAVTGASGIGGSGTAGVAGLAGAGTGVVGGASSPPAGMPSADAAASLAADPGVSNFASAGVSSTAGAQGSFSVDSAASAAGAGGAVGRVEGARGAVESTQATVADPTGAATAEAQGRATGFVSETAPVDPTGVSSRVETARSAIDNPEAAGEGQLRSTAEANAPQASVSVEVGGSASTPPVAPKK